MTSATTPIPTVGCLAAGALTVVGAKAEKALLAATIGTAVFADARALTTEPRRGRHPEPCSDGAVAPPRIAMTETRGGVSPQAE